MTIFDLFFLAAVLSTGVTTVALLLLLALKRLGAARRVALGWISIAGVYAAVALSVDAVRPQPVVAEAQPWCFDDWCITVTGVVRAPRADRTAYAVSMRISSTARRVSQRAAHAWIYLIDAEGRRYAPDSTVVGAPLDALLRPGEELDLRRTFLLPNGTEPIGLITGHGGPDCGLMSLLIIGGGGCLFGKPAMIRLGATP